MVLVLGWNPGALLKPHWFLVGVAGPIERKIDTFECSATKK